MSKPPTFLEFLASVHVTPTPAQRVYQMVTRMGIDPCDLEGADRELARELFGDIDRVPDEARHVDVCIKGARAGWTYICEGLDGAYAGLTADLSVLAPGEMGNVGFFSPRDDQSRQPLRFALGAFETNPKLKKMIVSKSADEFTIKRLHDGKLVRFWCPPTGRTAVAARGMWWCSAYIVEPASWTTDAAFVVRDYDTFRALGPRTVPAGILRVGGTPGIKEGLLFDLYTENFEHPVAAVAARAPSLTFCPTPRMRQIVAREKAKDPANAANEYECEWRTSIGVEVLTEPERKDARRPLPSHMRPLGAPFVSMDASKGLKGRDEWIAEILQWVIGEEDEYLYEQRKTWDGNPADPVRLGPNPYFRLNHGHSLLVVIDAASFGGGTHETRGTDGIVKDVVEWAAPYGCRHAIGDSYSDVFIEPWFRAFKWTYQGYSYSSTQKQEAVDLLQRIFRERSIIMPDVPELTRALEDFSAHYVEGDKVRYGGRKSKHTSDWVSPLIAVMRSMVQDESPGAPTGTDKRRFESGPGWFRGNSAA